MSRYFTFLFLSIFISASQTGFSQEVSNPKIELSKKTFGLNLGTGLFQQVSVNLFDFNENVIATSEQLIPLNLKASFSYYFTPKLAIRFSSGYGFSQQRRKNNIDFNKINSLNLKLKDESVFSITGFPAEVALVFKTQIDARANVFFHFGVGLGYYAYNYEAEGSYQEYESKTNYQQLERNYDSPEMTLSGSAQFFMLGFDMRMSQHIGATFEVSKLGWSAMTLTRDAVRQVLDDRGEIAYQIKYGYYQEDYTVKNGFDDIAISIGIFWSL